ncbi:hypothetical protein GH714_007419 [Hevea brasiliensis]|uniref:RING-type domain-containing protein n=1 Tax=Hevea brasiliensis TaxID=3981 RepID=A0A6A6M979_HEVBR|nr:hypothetical protein GH714_007419 [Hevea brasiliensis]
METSLRYGGDSKALRIHAKEKFPLDSKTLLQVHGALDTRIGAPNYFSAMIRRFYPDLSVSLGVGLQYDKHEELTYRMRAKKSFPVTDDGFLSFNIKGWCKIDKEFKERKSNGAAEFAWSIPNFQKDQDVRFKVGYELVDKTAFFHGQLQVSESISAPLPSAANKGLKKKILQSLPKQTFSPDSAAKFTDCSICLTEFSTGDEIRVLPHCGHGFHVNCVDMWLGSHSSCPSCRQILVVARCQKCGGLPASSSGGAETEAGLKEREDDANRFLP